MSHGGLAGRGSLHLDSKVADEALNSTQLNQHAHDDHKHLWMDDRAPNQAGLSHSGGQACLRRAADGEVPWNGAPFVREPFREGQARSVLHLT